MKAEAGVEKSVGNNETRHTDCKPKGLQVCSEHTRLGHEAGVQSWGAKEL